MPDIERMQELSGAKEFDDPAAAARDAKHPMLTARDEFAEGPVGTWVNDIGQVIEVYANGLTVTSEIPEYAGDGLDYYKAVVADAARESVYITTIQEVPALAVEPNTDKVASNPGLVRFELVGVSVIVSAKNTSVKDLSEIAEKLRPVSSGPRSQTSVE